MSIVRLWALTQLVRHSDTSRTYPIQSSPPVLSKTRQKDTDIDTDTDTNIYRDTNTTPFLSLSLSLQTTTPTRQSGPRSKPMSLLSAPPCPLFVPWSSASSRPPCALRTPSLLLPPRRRRPRKRRIHNVRSAVSNRARIRIRLCPMMRIVYRMVVVVVVMMMVVPGNRSSKGLPRGVLIDGSGTWG